MARKVQRKGREDNTAGAQSIKLSFLRQIPWMRALAFEEISQIAALFKEETYTAGTPIIRQGEEGKRFYVLWSGSARVELTTEGGVRVLSHVTPGDNFGEASLVSGQPCSASVVAQTSCVVLSMARDDFTLAVERSHSFSRALLSTLGERLAQQVGFEPTAVATPVNVIRLVGEDHEECAALAFFLAQAVEEQLRLETVPVIHASATGGGAAPEERADPSEVLERARGLSWVVVVGGGERWERETDFLIVVGGCGPLRSRNGERVVHVHQGQPLQDLPGRCSIRVDGRTALREAARARLSLGQLPVAIVGQLSRLARAATGRRVGIALGGGGAWGLAHVGVLRALSRLEVPVDLIAGTSAGALVGAVYAGGGLGALDSFMGHFRPTLSNVAQMARGAVMGAVSHRLAIPWFSRFLPVQHFRELEIPFCSVCYSVECGEERVLETGELAPAVTASNAMPMVLPPIPIGDELLIDGGFCNNVPTSVVYARGADLIIGVDVVPRVVVASDGWSLLRLPALSRLDSSMAAIYGLLHQAARSYTWLADVILEPELPDIRWFDYDRGTQIAELAERWVLERGGELKQRFAEFGRTTPSPLRREEAPPIIHQTTSQRRP